MTFANVKATPQNGDLGCQQLPLSERRKSYRLVIYNNTDNLFNGQSYNLAPIVTNNEIFVPVDILESPNTRYGYVWFMRLHRRTGQVIRCKKTTVDFGAGRTGMTSIGNPVQCGRKIYQTWGYYNNNTGFAVINLTVFDADDLSQIYQQTLWSGSGAWNFYSVMVSDGTSIFVFCANNLSFKIDPLTDTITLKKSWAAYRAFSPFAAVYHVASDRIFAAGKDESNYYCIAKINPSTLAVEGHKYIQPRTNGRAQGIHLLPNGNLAVVGFSYDGKYRVYLTGWDTSLNLLWAQEVQNYATTGSSGCPIGEGFLDNNGNYYDMLGNSIFGASGPSQVVGYGDRYVIGYMGGHAINVYPNTTTKQNYITFLYEYDKARDRQVELRNRLSSPAIIKTGPRTVTPAAPTVNSVSLSALSNVTTSALSATWVDDTSMKVDKYEFVQ